MFYYYDKENNNYICTEELIPFSDNIERIREEEYLAAITPSEEDIRKQKEEELRRLLRELYPDEEAAANEDTK